MSFENGISALLEKLSDSMKSETVVGEPIKVDKKTIIPVTTIKYGFGFSSSDQNKKANSSGFSAGGAKVDPIAFLVIDEDGVDLIPLKFKDTIFDKLIDAKNYEKIAKFVDKMRPKKGAKQETTEE